MPWAYYAMLFILTLRLITLISMLINADVSSQVTLISVLHVVCGVFLEPELARLSTYVAGLKLIIYMQSYHFSECQCIRTFPPSFSIPCSFHHYFIFLQRHAFIHPARALVKVMSMTTGELDYDDIFHHREGEEEIPFPLISFPLWIIFLVMMPVLLNNYLVRRMYK